MIAFHFAHVLLRDENGPGIARIGTDNRTIVKEQTDTRRPTEHCVNARLLFQSVLCLFERFLDLSVAHLLVFVGKPVVGE